MTMSGSLLVSVIWKFIPRKESERIALSSNVLLRKYIEFRERTRTEDWIQLTLEEWKKKEIDQTRSIRSIFAEINLRILTGHSNEDEITNCNNWSEMCIDETQKLYKDTFQDLLTYLYCRGKQFEEALGHVSNLIGEYEGNKFEQLRLKLVICQIHLWQSDLPQARHAFETVKETVNREQCEVDTVTKEDVKMRREAEFYMQSGIMCAEEGDFDEACIYLSEAVRIFSSLKDSLAIAIIGLLLKLMCEIQISHDHIDNICSAVIIMGSDPQLKEIKEAIEGICKAIARDGDTHNIQQILTDLKRKMKIKWNERKDELVPFFCGGSVYDVILYRNLFKIIDFFPLTIKPGHTDGM